MPSSSYRVKDGNHTFINAGKVPSTVEQINLAYTGVNKFSKRGINGKTINSGKNLQDNHLDSLIITSATSCNCSPSAPMWTIPAGTVCPAPDFNTYSYAVDSWCINYPTKTPNTYNIWVTYNECLVGKKIAKGTLYDGNPSSNCNLCK
jgi:hypothetical protein